MLWLTEDATLVCKHELGVVQIVATQNLVTVHGRRLLVQPDPEGRPIKGCPSVGVGIRPCVTTLRVQTGYSGWIRIMGRKICLDTVTGLTDGTPPGVVHYKVRSAGQEFVREKS